MPEVKKRKVQVSYTIDPDNDEFLKDIAKKRNVGKDSNVSASSIVNNLITNYKKLVEGGDNGE